MSVLIFLLLLGPWSGLSFASMDWCSLSVRVLSPGGQALQTYVTVREQNGRSIERESSAAGDARFCDLGILPVSVEVGLPGCNQVLVRDVPLLAGEMYQLVVTYDIEPCVQGKRAPPPTPVCEILFRVTDPMENWINGAEVVINETKWEPLRTDKAGRALLMISLGQRLTGMIRAGGYATKRFSLNCTREKSAQELLLKLGRE